VKGEWNRSGIIFAGSAPQNEGNSPDRTGNQRRIAAERRNALPPRDLARSGEDRRQIPVRSGLLGSFWGVDRGIDGQALAVADDATD